MGYSMSTKNAEEFLQRYERRNRICGWVLVLVCFFLGTVMTFGMHHWEKDISRAESVPAEATYQSCKEKYGRSSLAEILVQFSDLEQQAMDSAYASEALFEAINALEPGTKVSLLLHPNSAIILEFRVGDTVILDFEHATEALRREVVGFTMLGIFLYLIGLGFAVALLLPKSAKQSLRVFRNIGLSKGKTQSEAIRQILCIFFKPLRQLLLAGVGFAVIVPALLLLFGRRGWNVIWPPVLILLVFCLISLRVLIYRIRVWWELRAGKPQTRTIRVHELQADLKMRLLRYEDERKYLLTDDIGNAYHFVGADVGGEGALVVGQKLKITFLPKTGFLLSVVPYLKKGEEKRMKTSMRSVFVLYLNGRYEYEK